MRLGECVRKIELTDTPTSTESEFMKETREPDTVVEEAEGFYIICCVIDGDTMYEANIRLEQNGEFEFMEEKQVGEPMPCLRQIFLE